MKQIGDDCLVGRRGIRNQRTRWNRWRAVLWIALVATFVLEGCNSFSDDKDPWGCNDRAPLNVADLQLPVRLMGDTFEYDFGPTIQANVILLDSTKAAMYGLRQERSRLVGRITTGTYHDSLQWAAWENGTQCMGRSDSFKTYITFPIPF